MSSRIETWLKKNLISETECIFPDFTGSAKGKIIPTPKYIKDKGFSMPEAVFFQTVTGNAPDDLEGISSKTEIDMKLVPDFNTISIIPWAKDNNTAGLIHNCVHHDGSDVEFSPRNVLKRVLKYYKTKGWKPVIAPEMEFFLTQIEPSPHSPLQPPMTRFNRKAAGGNAYSMDALSDFDPLLETIYQYCSAQNISIDTLNHEYGTAQLEINFLHGDAMNLADDVFKFKRTCREAAIKHGMYATFMAKPLEDQPGSSMHFHQSVVDIKTGKNIFIDEKNKYNSNFYHFIGGIQKYLPSLMIFFAPNINSYRRFTPDWSAPTNSEWGVDNRTIGLRVPINTDPQNTRIENRLPGADTNPYLVIASSLAAGITGVEEKIEPRPPVNTGSYPDNDDFPKTLRGSILELDIFNDVHKILGNQFVKAYKLVKLCELEEYSKVISSWERQFLLLNV